MTLLTEIFRNFFRSPRRFTPCNDKSLYIIILLIVIASCSPSLYLPTEEVAEQTGIPLENLKQGRQIYVDRCGSCHMLYLPKQFTTPEWQTAMESMQLKVTFSDAEKQLMLNYLLAGK